MKKKHNGGYSLIEVLVAITVLGIVVVPICSSLLTSLRMNTKTESMLQSQLAVSSAVEELMAAGISADTIAAADTEEVEITAVADKEEDPTYYEVTVKSTENDSISVVTHIRAAEGGSDE